MLRAKGLPCGYNYRQDFWISTGVTLRTRPPPRLLTSQQVTLRTRPLPRLTKRYPADVPCCHFFGRDAFCLSYRALSYSVAPCHPCSGCVASGGLLGVCRVAFCRVHFVVLWCLVALLSYFVVLCRGLSHFVVLWCLVAPLSHFVVRTYTPHYPADHVVSSSCRTLLPWCLVVASHLVALSLFCRPVCCRVVCRVA